MYIYTTGGTYVNKKNSYKILSEKNGPKREHIREDRYSQPTRDDTPSDLRQD
jgi:hypothetical protein